MENLEWKEGLLQAAILGMYHSMISKETYVVVRYIGLTDYWKACAIAGFSSAVIGGIIHNIILPGHKNKEKFKNQEGALLTILVHTATYGAAMLALTGPNYIRSVGYLRIAGEAVGSNLIATFLMGILSGSSSPFS